MEKEQKGKLQAKKPIPIIHRFQIQKNIQSVCSNLIIMANKNNLNIIQNHRIVRLSQSILQKESLPQQTLKIARL